MSNLNIYQPTDSELEILQVIWEKEPITVRSIHERIAERRDVGYTTVLKQLQRMTEKGMVNREKKGKTHFYSAIPKEAEVQQSLFQRLTNTAYKGSAMKLVMHALGKSKTSDAELEELQKWLDAQKKNKK